MLSETIYSASQYMEYSCIRTMMMHCTNLKLGKQTTAVQ